MPLMRCTKSGKSGWKYGKSGHCYIGPGARARAAEQGRAIQASKHRRGDAAEDALMQIRYRRARMAERPRPRKRQPRWLHPVGVTVEYNRFLSGYLAAVTGLIDRLIVRYLQSLADQRALNIPRTDDWADDVDRLVSQVKTGVDGLPIGVPAAVADFASRTNVWNDREWRKQLRAALGVDIFQREPWLNETVNSWTRENTGLITSLTDDYVAQVEGIVQRGIRGGASVKRIQEDIRRRTGAAKSRARLIARDQISKLNGQLTELRQTNIGVKKYIWRDSDDRRVRRTHRANDNRTFRWDRPPAATGHPGWDYQCRCWAEPVFDEIIEEAKLAA